MDDIKFCIVIIYQSQDSKTSHKEGRMITCFVLSHHFRNYSFAMAADRCVSFAQGRRIPSAKSYLDVVVVDEISPWIEPNTVMKLSM